MVIHMKVLKMFYTYVNKNRPKIAQNNLKNHFINHCNIDLRIHQ